jgi:hypothetical protein
MTEFAFLILYQPQEGKVNVACAINSQYFIFID